MGFFWNYSENINKRKKPLENMLHVYNATLSQAFKLMLIHFEEEHHISFTLILHYKQGKVVQLQFQL
jgi:hypothetical protein